jgi:hypothetical protein
MRIKANHAGILVIAFAAIGGEAALAQTDVAASFYEQYSERTFGSLSEQLPAKSQGALVEVRHIRNPLFGFEATYAFNPANQLYDGSPITSIGQPGQVTLPVSVSADAHEITGDWVASLKLKHVRPFALTGVGLLLAVPSSSTTQKLTPTGPQVIQLVPSGTVAKPVYVYGAGIDWHLLSRLGLRFQIRGNLYSAPDLTKVYPPTGLRMQTLEPAIGAYFRL